MIKRNILILGSEGNRGAISIVRALQKENYVINIAISNNNKSDRFAFINYSDNFLYYDDHNSKDFIKSLIEFKNIIGKYYIFCLGDRKTEWLIKNKEILNDNNIEFEAPTHNSFKKMVYKRNFINNAKMNGLLAPPQISLEEAHNSLLNKDFIVLKAKNKFTLEKYKTPIIVDKFRKLEEYDLDKYSFIIQKYIKGPSVYYCAYYKKGEKISSFSQINLVQQPGGGSVLKAAPYNIDENIINKTDQMFKKLDWSGVMMIEFKIENNIYYAIECNPRYWGPNQLLVDNGINFPLIMLEGKGIIDDKIKMNRGYKWRNGYFLGYINKFRGLGKFQRYKVEFDTKIKYKDLWNRKDTRLYFYLEIFLVVIVTKIKKIFKRG